MNEWWCDEKWIFLLFVVSLSFLFLFFFFLWWYQCLCLCVCVKTQWWWQHQKHSNSKTKKRQKKFSLSMMHAPEKDDKSRFEYEKKQSSLPLQPQMMMWKEKMSGFFVFNIFHLRDIKIANHCHADFMNKKNDRQTSEFLMFCLWEKSHFKIILDDDDGSYWSLATATLLVFILFIKKIKPDQIDNLIIYHFFCCITNGMSRIFKIIIIIVRSSFIFKHPGKKFLAEQASLMMDFFSLFFV